MKSFKREKCLDILSEIKKCEEMNCDFSEMRVIDSISKSYPFINTNQINKLLEIEKDTLIGYLATVTAWLAVFISGIATMYSLTSYNQGKLSTIITLTGIILILIYVIIIAFLMIRMIRNLKIVDRYLVTIVIYRKNV